LAAEPALASLVEALRRLPGVGVKSAQRMAWHLLQHDREGARRIAGALEDAVARIRHCARCHTFTESKVCSICLDRSRDVRQLAVVETPADQAALERTGSYRGLYFVLMGRLSPLDGVGPSEIGARELLEDGTATPAGAPSAPVRRVAAVLAAELDWSQQRTADELARFEQEARAEGLLGS